MATSFGVGLTRDQLLVPGEGFRLTLERTLAGRFLPGFTSGFGLLAPSTWQDLWAEVGNRVFTVVSPRPGSETQELNGSSLGNVIVMDIVVDQEGAGQRITAILDRFEDKMGGWGNVFSIDRIERKELSESVAPAAREDAIEAAEAAGAGRVSFSLTRALLLPTIAIVSLAAIIVVPRFFGVKAAS